MNQIILSDEDWDNLVKFLEDREDDIYYSMENFIELRGVFFAVFGYYPKKND